MPRPIITRQVANAAGACFAAGDSIRRVAAAIGVQPAAIKQALDRGRSPDAPPHLQRMKERYDAYQAEENRREATRERLRIKLSRIRALEQKAG